MGMIEAEIWTIVRTDQGNAVLLRPLGSDISVPIFIGQFETQAILIGFGEIAIPRPLTHDLLIDVIRRLGFDLFRVEVHDVKDGTFYARLFLGGQNHSARNPLILDARPSDAFALAVRRKCPVFVSEKVVEKAGVSIDLIIDEVSGTGCSSGDFDGGSSGPEFKIQNHREVLQAELESAVEAEEYERAAEIRDILAILDKENGKKSI
ncbi:MAG: bifunctional nuclease family protein [Treponema sp.]|jgi:bifunctional DNase/RNase|nr:bifunctional nuclease family protein [Treponema sp.]